MVVYNITYIYIYSIYLVGLIGMATRIGQISDQNRATVPGRGSQMLVIYNINLGYTISQFLG